MNSCHGDYKELQVKLLASKIYPEMQRSPSPGLRKESGKK
ncbi:hypothetical protein A33Q_1909 [Indibacter alkaliphilus LW1]|uniref:Uncharacterized protein n=1 Tax=Indibacter alkaliphilus (strain CCUG 57479 / KCTC 22604 / LW1) TaxID=1189612 RepID=S2DXX7_INDAL|nr:hypothetical protein A33Q_1909 [Indibacter alkaliphilus LW1]